MSLQQNLKIIIITGLSGSGKSAVIAAFEDAAFFCVDNMPIALLPKFLELPIKSAAETTGFAFVMDLREKSFLSTYLPVFELLRKKGYDFEMLFLEADDEILLQRYSQTRRRHPLSCGRSLIDGIRDEREQLKELKRRADKIIDTSYYSVHKLKSTIFDIAQKTKKLVPMRINILSFGFKYGTPQDADLIIDVRFLANPYFVPELKDLDGRTKEVENYVLSNNETRVFLRKYLDMLDYLIPLYEKEGKAYLTIAVGCTGGWHRSVVITQAIFKHINRPERQIGITHRDIGR